MHLYIVFIVQCTINMVQISDHQYTPSASLPISLYIYIHALRIALRNKPVLRNYAVVLLDIGYAGALCPRDVISRLFITAWQIKQAQPSLRLDVHCTVYSVQYTVYTVHCTQYMAYSARSTTFIRCTVLVRLIRFSRMSYAVCRMPNGSCRMNVHCVTTMYISPWSICLGDVTWEAAACDAGL